MSVSKWLFLALLLMTQGAWAQGTITNSTPDVQVTAKTGGGYTIGSRVSIVDLSTAGGAIPSGDGQSIVKVGNFPYTIAQAGSTGFSAGWNTTLINVSKNAGAATITNPGVFEGVANGGHTISLPPGGGVTMGVDGSNYLLVGAGGYTSTASGTPDGTKSTPPSGPALTAADGGVWTWGAAVANSGGGYYTLLNGANVNGIGVLMEVAHSGKLYVQAGNGSWWIWTGSAWMSTAAP